MRSAVPKYDDVMFDFLLISRYLFQARIYSITNLIKPKIDGDPSDFIEEITKMGKTAQSSNAESHNFGGRAGIDVVGYAEYPMVEKFSETDIDEITKTIQLINRDEWITLNPEKIEKSQEILLKFLRIYRSSIK